MFKKIVISLFVGALASIYLIQNDQATHDWVAQKCKTVFETNYNCSFVFNVKKVNIFNQTIVLENLLVEPKNKNNTWFWQAKTCTLSLSWKSLLLCQLGLNIYVDDLQAHSTLAKSKLALLDEHIHALLAPTDTSIPVYLKSLSFKRATLKIQGSDPAMTLNMTWDSESKKIGQEFKSNIYIATMHYVLSDQSIISSCVGTVHVDVIPNNETYVIKSKVHCTAEIDQLPQGKRTCFINGQWLNQDGKVTIRSSDKAVEFDDITLALKNGNIHIHSKGHLPLSYIIGILNPSVSWAALNSDIKLQFRILANSQGYVLNGRGFTDAISYNDTKITDTARFTFNKHLASWQGSTYISRDLVGVLHGNWAWHEQEQQGTIHLFNPGIISSDKLPFWYIPEREFDAQLSFNNKRTAKGDYRVKLVNEKKEEAVIIKGDSIQHDKELSMQGAINSNTYALALYTDPTLMLKSFTYKDKEGSPLISLQETPFKPTSFIGSLAFAAFQKLIQQWFNYTLQGQGLVTIQGELDAHGVHIKTKLDNGAIRLPNFYNIIKDFKTDIDIFFNERKILLNGTECNLYNGTLKSDRAVLYYDSTYAISNFHIPLIVDSCVLNVNRDLFGVVSGAAVLTQKDKELALLKGNFLIDRSYLKENLLSDSFQKKIGDYTGAMFETQGPDMALDVTIETKKPIRLDTPFFQSDAKVALHVQNTVSSPHVSGSIELLSGVLNFPYSPLYIAKGVLNFVPHQLYDPLIELIAKNRIKKHDVTLHVTGSLQNNHISLQSSPPVSEDQIMGLLLVGSAQQSLNTMVPALIMQNLKSALFDSEHSPLKAEGFMRGWLKTFKHVHLVPSFADQTGRGGLKGAIEIEVNDRWRASAQKNFSLTEDTRFEVEYLVSDDISLRGIRDERKDVGGEVEMRWKFGG